MHLTIGALRFARTLRVLPVALLVVCWPGSAAAGQIGFVYALQQVNGGTNQIHGFRFDQTTGVLTQLPGFPIASGGTGTTGFNSEQLAYRNGRLFVLNDGDNTLTIFSVSLSTGALAAMPFSPVALGAGSWGCVAVHPTGSPVVVGDGGGGLSSFVVTSGTATPAPGNPFATGSAVPFSCSFSQDGNYVYSGGNVGTTIAGFSVNAGTGVLSALPGSPFNAGGNNPAAYVTDSSGRLFSAMASAGEVAAFVTKSGELTGVSDNPFTSGLTGAAHGVLHPGNFYMVADRLGNRVGVFQIAGAGTATTLSAVSGSPFAAGGTLTTAVALSSDGVHLLAANGTSRNLTVFQVNQATGALAIASVQAANTLGTTGNVTGLAFVAAEAGFVYALQQIRDGPNYIHGFRINPANGVLEGLPGFPIATGGTGSELNLSESLAYRNGRLYAINVRSRTLSAYKINRTTGALTPLPFSPLTLGFGAACVAVHPTGSPVVVGEGSALASFDVNATTATAAPGSPFATTGAVPFSCAFSTDGNYVYTGGSSGNGFAGFAVDAASAILTPLPGTPFVVGGISSAAYTADPTGRLFLVVRNSAGNASVMAYTTSGGVPTGVSGNPFPSGLGAGYHGIRHPSGFYMAVDRTPSIIDVYRIAGTGSGTTLTAVAGSPFSSGGVLTDALALTEDGTWLVAANGVTRNLTVFSVNPATGVLQHRFIQAVDTLGSDGLIIGLALAPVVPPFIDDPLTAVTPPIIKAVHITELRSRIAAVRAQYGLGPYAFIDPALTVATTQVRGVHVTDLRAALAEVYTALGMTPPSYTDPTLGVASTVVKFAHIMELRAAVLAIE